MASRASTLTGAAGEHFIAYRLSAMGYPVALTRGGSPTVDLKWDDDNTSMPDVFIVPSKVVADTFNDPSWSMYVFWIMQKDKDDYFERWDLITKRLDR